MKLALAQYALSSDVNANLVKVLDLMREAARRQAELMIFPELCLSPFFPQFAGQDASQYAMTLHDDRIRQIQDVCRELRLAASPNVYLDESGRRFDASLMIGVDGKIQGISKMVHIAQLPGFYEQGYYAPSDTGFKVYDTPSGKIGIVVCFDRHFPESIRTCVLSGAQVILIPTANTIHEPQDLFEYEIRVAGMQNGVFIAMCNRVGTEGEVSFCGDSLAVDPDGGVIAKAGETEELLVVDLDLAQTEVARRKRPYLSLRNPDVYEHGEREPRGYP